MGDMAVDTVMVVMDMVDIVASVPPMLMLTMVMDMDVVMDMVVTDMVDTVERDPLSHTTDMVDTEDMEVTDMVVVMATAMDVKAYLQEANCFHYLIFQIDF